MQGVANTGRMEGTHGNGVGMKQMLLMISEITVQWKNSTSRIKENTNKLNSLRT